jgi:hypothetical protein
MKSDSGNREWLNDYMSLKQVNPNNPFTVPSGYFDESEQQIVSFIKLDELKNSAPPEGFTVPENYFEQLSNAIQARINVDEALNKEVTCFTVPEGYFDNMQQQIQSRILVGKALSEPAVGFDVPQDYFSQLTQNILNKTSNQETANRKGVIRKLFSSVAFKYATAACFTLVMGGVIFLTQNTNNAVKAHNRSFLHQSLSAIPIDEIQNYLKLNVDATDTHALIDESKQVNADNLSNGLQDYLDTTSQ